MMHTDTPSPVPADVSFDTVPACDAPDGCGSAAGRPCKPGCPSIATDEYGATFADAPELLVVSADQALLGEMLPLVTAVCGTHSGRRIDGDDADELAELWATAGIVLLGADVAERVAASSLPYRGEVIVAVGPGEIPSTVWRAAANCGGAYVVQFPEATPWLIEKVQGGR